MQSLPSRTLWTAAWPNCSHDVCMRVCAVCVSIKDNYYYTCNATINGIINASAHAQRRATFSGLHNFRKDEQHIDRQTGRQTERLSSTRALSLWLYLSLNRLYDMQSQSKTLCVAPPRPPLPCSGAGNVQFGFSLRLFNSSHIFFIDFSTPAFLWSIRSSSL